MSSLARALGMARFGCLTGTVALLAAACGGRTLDSDLRPPWAASDVTLTHPAAMQTGPCHDNMGVNGLAYGAGQYVAVGRDEQSTADGTGLICSSSDGRIWHPTATELDFEVTDVVYGNGLFVAIAGAVSIWQFTTNRVYLSSDGLSWQGVELEGGPFARRLAFGHGQFLAAYSLDHAVSCSVDGLVWERMSATFHPQDSPYQAMAFAGDTFVLQTATNVVYYSQSGVSWAGVDVVDQVTPGSSATQVSGLHAVHDRFVLRGATVPSIFEAGAITYSQFESSDGRLWTQHAAFGDAADGTVWVEDPSTCIAFSEKYGVQTAMTCDALSGSVNSDFHPRTALSVNGIYLVGGDTGILRSTNGYNWEEVVGIAP